MVKILFAEPRGFCGGVERALRIAEKELSDHPGKPLYLLHEIVHNETVSSDLEKKGGKIVSSVKDIPEGGHLLISAHGTAKKIFDDAATQGVTVIDATCPLVRKVQETTSRLVAEGYHVLLFGHRAHREVMGILGQCAMPDRITVLENLSDVEAFEADHTEKYACLSQTTWNQETVQEMTDILQQKIPGLCIAGSVCNATAERQNAVRHLAEKCDVCLIIGSASSSNTMRLLEIASGIAPRAYLVERTEDLTAEMIAGADTIGIASGASAPEKQVISIVQCIHSLI